CIRNTYYNLVISGFPFLYICIRNVKAFHWYISYRLIIFIEIAYLKTVTMEIDLNLDFRKLDRKVLPIKWNENDGKRIVLQIQKIRNIAVPKALEDKMDFPYFLRIDLTDGKSDVVGLVSTPVKGLNMQTPPGTKLQITCPVENEKNFIFLNNSNCCLLGGTVQKLFDNWNANRIGSLSNRTGVAQNKLAPQWIPFAKKEQNEVLPSMTQQFRSLSVTSKIRNPRQS
ncbi:Tudor domain-containing protein 3, partial [Trichinella nativa]